MATIKLVCTYEKLLSYKSTNKFDSFKKYYINIKITKNGSPDSLTYTDP